MWELDLRTLAYLGSGPLGATGTVTLPLTAPPVVAGAPLYWQAIEICTSKNAIGPAAGMGFYR